MLETEQENKPITPDPKYITARVMYLTVIAMAIFAVTASISIYDYYFATKIIVYDLPGKLLLIKKAAEEGKITFQQAEQVSALEIAEAKRISDAAPSNYIVLSGDAVLARTTEK